jgi:hypothetical protein
MPSLTITQDPLDSIFHKDFFKNISNEVKSDRPVVVRDDPFALSVASWRKAVESKYAIRWMTLSECRATDTDRIRAAEMKKFYQDKIAIRALKDSKMTNFNHDLYKMLNTSQVTDQQLGMLMRLPYFYQEDLDRMEIAQQVNCLPRRRINLAQAMRHETVIHQLKPLKKIFMGRKGSELWEYWFVTEFNDPVCWSVKLSNPLISVVEGIFLQPCCCIEGQYQTGQRQGNNLVHFWIGSPRIVFDQPNTENIA